MFSRSTQLSNWPAYVVLVFLAASTVSTKSAGAFWLALFVMGVFYQLRKQAHVFTSGPDSDSKPVHLKNIAAGWLLFCVLALVFKSIPMIYWSGPWEERHAVFRLLIGAIACHLLFKYQRLPQDWSKFAGHALALSCALAFALVASLGSFSAPTNRIPWAAGVSLLSCVLLTWSFVVPTSANVLAFWRLTSLLGVCAVLISGVRGSYLLALVWPALWWRLTWQKSSARKSDTLKKILLAALIFIAAISLAPQTISPLSRVQAVLTDVGLSSESKAIDPNSSNGARLILWRSGIEAIQNHWFIGMGFDGAKDVIKQASVKYQSQTVASLGHYHNDYIHTAVEFGLFGLLSYLCYGFGMAWCAWRLYGAKHMAESSGMLAILTMHAGTGLTNMNFAHNYYPTVLSLTITLMMLSPQLHQLTKRNSPCD
jgi:O-antigen ligase